MSGKIICLESLDAGGKSTQSKLIEQHFEKHNIKSKYIHFPIYGDNVASSIVAAYLRGEYGDINEVDPIFVANIYAMDRYLYLPTLQKLITEYDVIILDRYVFSNMAYQGAKYETSTQTQLIINWISEFEFEFLKLPYPDLTIFFDVPIKCIEKRLNQKREGNDRDYLDGKVDIHEKDIQFQIQVRNNYLELEKIYTDYIIIPTEDLSPEEIFLKYKKYIMFNLKIE